MYIKILNKGKTYIVSLNIYKCNFEKEMCRSTDTEFHFNIFLVHSIYEPCEDTEYIKKMGEDCLKTYYRNLTAATDHHSFCRFVQAKPFLKEATVKIIVAYFYFLKTIYESFKLFRKHIISKHINRMFMKTEIHTFTTTVIHLL